jgi:hypothetical protein
MISITAIGLTLMLHQILAVILATPLDTMQSARLSGNMDEVLLVYILNILTNMWDWL